MKIVLIVVLGVLMVVFAIVGGVGFDYYRQNQQMTAVESRLDLISSILERRDGNATGVDGMLDSAEMELTQFSGRWVSTRKYLAQNRISKLRMEAKAKSLSGGKVVNGLPSNDEFQKTVKDLIDKMNSNKK